MAARKSSQLVRFAKALLIQSVGLSLQLEHSAASLTGQPIACRVEAESGSGRASERRDRSRLDRQRLIESNRRSSLARSIDLAKVEADQSVIQQQVFVEWQFVRPRAMTASFLLDQAHSSSAKQTNSIMYRMTSKVLVCWLTMASKPSLIIARVAT